MGDPATTAGRWHQLLRTVWCPVTGDGAVRYRHLLSETAGSPVPVIEPPPLAATMALVAEQRARAGESILPHAIRPLYVRRPDAELARNRRRERAVTEPYRIDVIDGPADLDGIQEVDRLSFPSPWTRAMYEEELRHAGTAFIIVLRSGVAPVAGYCSYRLVADEVQVNNVAVRPEHRRQGVRPGPRGIRPRSRPGGRRPHGPARGEAVEPRGAAPLPQPRVRAGRRAASVLQPSRGRRPGSGERCPESWTGSSRLNRREPCATVRLGNVSTVTPAAALGPPGSSCFFTGSLTRFSRAPIQGGGKHDRQRAGPPFHASPDRR